MMTSCMCSFISVCEIGITVDNVFEAFIDGTLVASGDIVNSQTRVTVLPNSNVNEFILSLLLTSLIDW